MTDTDFNSMNLTVAYWAENFLVTPPTLVQHLQKDLSNNNALNYLAKILFYICNFGIFCENFIFANSVRRHI